MKRKNRTVISLLVAFGMLLPPGTGGSGREVTASVAVRESTDAITEHTDSTTSYTDADTGYTYTLFEKKVAQGSSSCITMAEITGYTGNNGNLKIPVSFPSPSENGTDVPVGKIGAQAFMENPAITEVTIPEGIETIGFRAFYGCENLKKASIPASITSWDCNSNNIESGAFCNCTGLTELTLADGLEIIGGYAFAGCTALESVRLPSHLSNFYDEAFSDCTSLLNLELPEGITEIGKKAFRGCISLTEIQIPSTIQSWNHTKYSNIMAPDYVCAAFADCTSLSKVTFAEGLTTLAYANLFPGCTALKSVTVPSSVKKLTRAFEGCDYLEEIILSDGLETIGEYAFRNCSALQQCRISSTVRNIEVCAFQGCSSLETVVFPENMTGLGASVFNGCTNMKSLCFLAEDLQYFADILPNSNTMVYCFVGSTTWKKCLEKLQQSGREENLAALPEIETVQIIPYTGEYDETPHPAFSLNGIQNGDQVRCWTLKEDGTSDQHIPEIPQITEPGIYTYQVVIQRNSSVGSPILCSRFQITSEIQKKKPVLVFGKLQFEEQTDYEVALAQYNGESTVTYRYYSDPACQKRLSSKPKTPGTYYIVAICAESQYYLAGQTEAAELIITEAALPPEGSQQPQGTQPPGSSGDPSETQPPGSSENPSETQLPGSSGDPSETQPPGSSGNPSETQSPGSSGDPSATQSPGSSGDPSETQSPGSSGNPPASQLPGSSGNPPAPQLPGNSGTPQKPDNSNQNKVSVKKISLQKVRSPKKKTLQITWKKTTGISGYQICIALDQKMKKGKKQITVKGNSKTNLTIKKLKSNKSYYVRVRAYQTVQGKKYYGNWSKIKKKKVK